MNEVYTVIFLYFSQIKTMQFLDEPSGYMYVSRDVLLFIIVTVTNKIFPRQILDNFFFLEVWAHLMSVFLYSESLV